MTNTTYDLKPGYYWKITPSTDHNSAAILSLMQITTSWDADNGIAGYYLERNPADPEATLEKAMSRIKEYYPKMFADYTEDVIQYDKTLKSITSSAAD